MSTKEKIVIESLKLFSIKGYYATSTKDIADSLGIKDSSLYKHYASKKAILDAIFEYVKVYIDEKYQSFLVISPNERKDAYVKMSQEELISLAKKLYGFYTKDETIKSFRKMLSIERHHNNEASNLYSRYFIESVINYQTQVFTDLIEKKVLAGVSPLYMAYAFYSLLFMLIHMSDEENSIDVDASFLIETHIKSFWKLHHTGENV